MILAILLFQQSYVKNRGVIKGTGWFKSRENESQPRDHHRSTAERHNLRQHRLFSLDGTDEKRSDEEQLAYQEASRCDFQRETRRGDHRAGNEAQTFMMAGLQFVVL